LIRPEDFAIVRKELAAHEIQESSPRLGVAAHKFNIRAAKVHDPQDIEIRTRDSLHDSIERKFSPSGAVVKLKVIS
jgi:hypothetical protein